MGGDDSKKTGTSAHMALLQLHTQRSALRDSLWSQHQTDQSCLVIAATMQPGMMQLAANSSMSWCRVSTGAAPVDSLPKSQGTSATGQTGFGHGKPLGRGLSAAVTPAAIQPQVTQLTNPIQSLCAVLVHACMSDVTSHTTDRFCNCSHAMLVCQT